MDLLYRIAADLLVTIHVAYVGFVLLGFAAILLGIVLRWEWIRNVWFRLLHLACILVVVAESLLGITCPLTVWEKNLRRQAGQAAYRGDFIANWLHELLFFDLPPQAFTFAYTAFGALVVLAFFVAPPRWQKRAAGSSA